MATIEQRTIEEEYYLCCERKRCTMSVHRQEFCRKECCARIEDSLGSKQGFQEYWDQVSLGHIDLGIEDAGNLTIASIHQKRLFFEL